MSERNPIHEAEREEARAAARYARGPCWQHDWRSDGRGGGVCIGCGDTVSREEIS